MYSARITRLNPTAFVILIDQSGSMSEKVYFNSDQMTKAEAVAMVANLMISELLYRCQREVGIANYFEIAALGYSGIEVTSLLDPKKLFHKPTELAAIPRKKRQFSKERRLPNGNTIITTSEHTCWIEPKAEGNTPMCTALHKAFSLASLWCSKSHNRASYPLTIFNITDGEASDGDRKQLYDVAEQIKTLRTEDGNVLLINIHICSDKTKSDVNVVFPCSTDELPDVKYAGVLYELSSVMPEQYNEIIGEMKTKFNNPPYRGMSFNTSIIDVISMMNIGSMSVNIM